MNTEKWNKDMAKIQDNLHKLESLHTSRTQLLEDDKDRKITTFQPPSKPLEEPQPSSKQGIAKAGWHSFLNFYFWATIICSAFLLLLFFFVLLPYFDEIKQGIYLGKSILDTALENKEGILNYLGSLK